MKKIISINGKMVKDKKKLSKKQKKSSKDNFPREKIFFSIIISVLIFDQITKILAKNLITKPIFLIPKVFSLN